MSVPRKTVRSTIKTALEAVSLFSGVTVVLNNFTGTAISALEEKTRAAPGCVISIPLILGTVRAGQAGARGFDRARVIVEFRSNPALNTAIDPDDAVDAIKKAVFAVASLCAEADEEPDELIQADAGLITYNCNFLIPLTQP